MLVHGIHVNNQAVPYTGTITEINDTYFFIQLTGRLGVLKLPIRWMISEDPPSVGDKVKILMSYVEMADETYEKEDTDTL